MLRGNTSPGASHARHQLLTGMIRYGWAVASRRPTPGVKSTAATVADQYDHRR